MDGNCWWGRVACEMEDRIDEGTRVKGEGMNEIGGEACDVACTIVVITPPPPLLRQSTHSHSSSCSPLTNNRLTGRLLPLQSTGCWPPPDFFGPLATGRRLTQSTPWPTTEVDQLPSVVRHPGHDLRWAMVECPSCAMASQPIVPWMVRDKHSTIAQRRFAIVSVVCATLEVYTVNANTNRYRDERHHHIAHREILLLLGGLDTFSHRRGALLSSSFFFCSFTYATPRLSILHCLTHSCLYWPMKVDCRTGGGVVVL